MTWTWLFVWNAFWLISALLYLYLESLPIQGPDSEDRRLRMGGTESESAYRAIYRDEINYPCQRRLRHWQRPSQPEHRRPRRPPGRGSQRF
jgi:hypothetical protein